MPGPDPSPYSGATTFLAAHADQDAVATTCHVLKNHYRQYVILYVLASRPTMVSAGELATWIAAIEDHVPCQQVRGDRRKSIRNTLLANHLPLLTEENIIDFDASRKFITPGDRFDHAARVLLTLFLTVTRTA